MKRQRDLAVSLSVALFTTLPFCIFKPWPSVSAMVYHSSSCVPSTASAKVAAVSPVAYCVPSVV